MPILQKSAPFPDKSPLKGGLRSLAVLARLAVPVGLTALASLGLLSGCSLLGLDSFELPQCQSDQDCMDAFNGPAGHYPECRAFVCDLTGDRGTCRALEGEICDGADNDCDRIIDEPAGDTQVFSPDFQVLSDLGVARPANLNVASDGAMGLIANWPELSDVGRVDGTAQLSNLSDEADVTLKPLSFATNETVHLAEHGLTDDGSCGALALRLTDNPLLGGRGTCTMVDLVRAQAGGGSLVAAISRNGCLGGSLRIGFTTVDAPERVVEMGPGRRSTVYRGVDVTPDGRCTQNNTTACQDAIAADDTSAIRQTCGATVPALSLMDISPAEGLLTYLGAPSTRAECGGESVEVQALGVYRRSGNFSGLFEWVDATGEGHPQVLGRTRGGGRPAQVPLEQRGYVVAHGDADGALAIHFVPRAPTYPGRNNGFECESGAPCSDEGSEDRTGVETDRLPAFTDFPPIAAMTSGAVDHVSIALGRSPSADTYELGLSWREGCGDSPTIVFQRILLDFAATSPSLITLGNAVVLSEAPFAHGPPTGPPVLVHTDGGMLAGGFERGGLTSSVDSAGGFFVIWPTGAGLLARRLSDLDSMPVSPLESSPPILLVSGPSVRFPQVYGRSGEMSSREPALVFIDSEQSQLIGGPLRCADTLTR